MIKWILAAGAAVFLAAGLRLVSEEIRGWLDLVPRGLLWLAAGQLNESQRQTIYREEWLPDLELKLIEAGSRPITRLIIGIRHSIGPVLAARFVGRRVRRMPIPETFAHAGVAEARAEARAPRAAMTIGKPSVQGSGPVITRAATLTGKGTQTAGAAWIDSEDEARLLARRSIEQMAAETRSRIGVRPIVPPSSERPGDSTI